MLSILIPVYNVKVKTLVNDLLAQAHQLNVTCELVLEDDASTDAVVRAENARLASADEVVYIQNEQNKGRSKVRNHLAQVARYPYLIFMDCDANVCRPDYLSVYIQHIQSRSSSGKPFVVLGGLCYRETMPDEYCRLRWIYGRDREQKSAVQRNLSPYRSFTPFNMLISKSVFSNCQFDESLTTYGFEDTFFGEQLLEAGVEVQHLDNPLYHDGLDENEIFLHKVEISIDNMVLLIQSGKVSEHFIQNSKLLTTYYRCQRKHLLSLVHWGLRLHKSLLRKLILKHCNMRALDLYKLYLLCEKTR